MSLLTGCLTVNSYCLTHPEKPGIHLTLEDLQAKSNQELADLNVEQDYWEDQCK